jgi:hypothetical protein
MRIDAAGKWFIIGFIAAISSSSVTARQYDQKLNSEMRWRCIGPFRGGRTVAISGVPHQPNVFYMAAVNGGVWKTTDFGNTWNPIFDDQPTGSVGALAVAPSDPNIIYAGSGEGLQRPDLATGDGVYKSTDAGKSWTHLGLRDAQQITAILVDPKDPNRVFVAAEGHPYGPNAERGVFRSTDGGQSFQKVLYKGENTGAADLAFDPTNPQTIYAVFGPRALRHGRFAAANLSSAPAAAFSNPPMAEATGTHSAKVFPLQMTVWAGSASPSRIASPVVFMQPWRQRKMPASTAPTTREKAGSR